MTLITTKKSYTQPYPRRLSFVQKTPLILTPFVSLRYPLRGKRRVPKLGYIDQQRGVTLGIRSLVSSMRGPVRVGRGGHSSFSSRLANKLQSLSTDWSRTESAVNASSSSSAITSFASRTARTDSSRPSLKSSPKTYTSGIAKKPTKLVPSSKGSGLRESRDDLHRLAAFTRPRR